MKTREFAKFVGVSQPAIVKAEKEGRVARNKKGNFDPRNKANKIFIESNKKIRVSQRASAHVARLVKGNTPKGKAVSTKGVVEDAPRPEPASDEPKEPGSEVDKYLTNRDLEREKLLVDIQAKKLAVAETMGDIIRQDLVAERLSKFAAVLQNSILILPEKLRSEFTAIYMKKGKAGEAAFEALLSKHIALGIKKAQKALKDVTANR